MKKILFVFFVPTAILLCVWYLASIHIASSLILPSPLFVFTRFLLLIKENLFWEHVFYTILRTILSFLYSLVISIILGIAIGFSKSFSLLLKMPLSVIKATPVVSFILLALFWFTTSQVPIFVSVLMTLPIITSSVALGIANIDIKLRQMARVYGLTKKQKILHIYLPSVFPSFASGALSAFGLSWKVVVAAEVISLPKRAIGTSLQTAKVHIETADVFAISILIIALSFVLELLLSALFKNCMKWREKDA
jgi:NitT/TauT family transport system permease protein